LITKYCHKERKNLSPKLQSKDTYQLREALTFIRRSLERKSGAVILVFFTIFGGLSGVIAYLQMAFAVIWGPILLFALSILVAIATVALLEATKGIPSSQLLETIGARDILGNRELTGGIFVDNLPQSKDKVKILTISGITLFSASGVDRVIINSGQIPIWVLLLDPDRQRLGIELLRLVLGRLMDTTIKSVP